MIHFENRDCVEAMREFPDNFFDLAIVDPPYGDGSQTVNVERERVDRSITASAGVSTSTSVPRGGWHGKQKYHLGTYTISERIAENRTEHGVMRTGGQWAAKYAKKSLRGMSRRNRNILTSCFASHVIR